MNFCACGCSQEVTEGKQWIRGHSSRRFQGDAHPRWKGGFKNDKNNGYVYIWTSGGYVPYHRFLLEEYLERSLEPGEVSHHCNKKKDDNRIENIELVTHSEHNKIHWPERGEKIIKANTGKVRTEETKQRMREAWIIRKSKPSKGNGRRGKIHSEKTKIQMSESAKTAWKIRKTNRIQEIF